VKLIFWLCVIVVAAALACFAVANRDVVSLGFWPVPFALDVPLYLAVLAAVVLGFLLGAIAAWSAGGGRRREMRQRGRRIAALERELSLTQAQMSRSAPVATLPVVTRG
jgi:uncharacterized integral membrane protein